MTTRLPLKPHRDANQCARGLAGRGVVKPQLLLVVDAPGGVYHRLARRNPRDPFWLRRHRSVGREQRRPLFGWALPLDQCERRVPTETPQHVVGAVLTFSCASTGLIVLSRRMAADPQWHDLSTYVLGTGIVMLILFILVGGFAVDEGTPFHRWAGLLQLVLVGAWFACLLVMARRVLRIALSMTLRGHAQAQGHTSPPDLAPHQRRANEKRL